MLKPGDFVWEGEQCIPYILLLKECLMVQLVLLDQLQQQLFLAEVDLIYTLHLLNPRSNYFQYFSWLNIK
jgi:hypothetical protein